MENEDDHVWGVLWELDIKDLATLDKQEGVPRVYNRKHIEVRLGYCLPVINSSVGFNKV